jgi:hypothetical protein
MSILNAVNERFDTSLFDMNRLLQSELLDAELQAARDLAKNKFLRSAGAICGVILIKHFEQVRNYHQLKIKKNSTINDYNELFKTQSIYSFAAYRQVQYLYEIWFLCCRNKKDMPTTEEVQSLIEGVEKVIKTVF